MSAAHSDPGPMLKRCMGPVARELLGDPTEETKSELRFGTRGSMSVMLEKGVWHDHEAGKGGGVIDLVMTKRSTDKDGAMAWLRERKHIPPAGRNIVQTYDYTDASGTLLFQVCRMEPKDFRQRRPDGLGRWVWKMTGVERVLYHLPEIVAAVAAGQIIYIAEGEKGVDALRSLGVAATCSPGGANKWRREYATPLDGADVVVLPDNDKAGSEHAAMVIKGLRGLHGRAARIRVLDLPDLPEKGDVADWIAAGGTAETLATLTEAAPEAEAITPPPRERPKREERTPTGLPMIRVVAGELHNVVTAAEDAIISAGVPLYQRGPGLVRPASREVPAAHGRTTLAAGMAEVNAHALVDVLCGVAEWERFDARAEAWVRITPPRQVADILLSRYGQWRVPHVAGVVTTPTMRADGSILSAPGYDPATRLYHVADPDLVLHPMVQNPTREHALAALKALKDLLVEFPFVVTKTESQSDQHISLAVALSALITPVVRGAIPVAPAHAFRANTAGSGKSYLADTASAIATGRPCPVISAAPGDEAETEKRITGLLLAGFPIISLDNVNGELGGDLLCQAIERPLVRVRPLGRSEIVEIESRSTIFCTGNNLRVRGDMVRRTLPCDLDPAMERPEERPFKGDPVATILANRSLYVSAALIIVRAYLLAGSPNKLQPIASFEDWSERVRSALVWLGCADPALSMKAARDDDPELAELSEVMGAWRKAFGRDETTCRAAIDRASEKYAKADENGDVSQYAQKTELRLPELHDVLQQIAGLRGVIDPARLGRWMMARQGRMVGTERFKRSGISGGTVRWKLEKIHPQGVQGG